MSEHERYMKRLAKERDAAGRMTRDDVNYVELVGRICLWSAGARHRLFRHLLDTYCVCGRELAAGSMCECVAIVSAGELVEAIERATATGVDLTDVLAFNWDEDEQAVKTEVKT